MKKMKGVAERDVDHDRRSNSEEGIGQEEEA